MTLVSTFTLVCQFQVNGAEITVYCSSRIPSNSFQFPDDLIILSTRQFLGQHTVPGRKLITRDLLDSRQWPKGKRPLGHRLLPAPRDLLKFWKVFRRNSFSRCWSYQKCGWKFIKCLFRSLANGEESRKVFSQTDSLAKRFLYLNVGNRNLSWQVPLSASIAVKLSKPLPAFNELVSLICSFAYLRSTWYLCIRLPAPLICTEIYSYHIQLINSSRKLLHMEWMSYPS